MPPSNATRLFLLMTENGMKAHLLENREAPTSTLQLLVVADDLPYLELIARTFSSLKAHVFPVNDGHEAVVLLNNKKFDGIFVDLEMAHFTGPELTIKVRTSSCNKSTPVIALTGREDAGAMQQAFEAGATFYFHKPMDENKLAGLLRSVQGALLETRCRHARVPLQTEVICSVRHRGMCVTSLNLSVGGVQVEADDLKSGEAVELSFRLPNSNMTIEGFGIVVCSDGNRRRIQFTRVSPQSETDIRQFITQAEQHE